jgi:hypothetical protein
MGIINSTYTRVRHYCKGYKLNGYHVIYYFNFTSYKGYFLNGKFHGEGEFYYNCDMCKKGTWVHGKFEGKNQMIKERDCVLHGTWVDNQLINPVRIEYNNGDVYEGDVQPHDGEFVFCGNGTYTQASGHVRNGMWNKGKFTGVGEKLYQNGTLYQVCRCEIHLDTNGTLYQGEFRNGKLHGKGKYTFNTGDVAEGQFVNNKFTGYGTLVTDSIIRTGNFVESQLRGQGTVIQRSTGLKREGIWDDFTLVSGVGGYKEYNRVYHGQWRNNQYNGKGVLVVQNPTQYPNMPTTTTYEGYFAAGEYLGPNLPDELGEALDIEEQPQRTDEEGALTF